MLEKHLILVLSLEWGKEEIDLSDTCFDACYVIMYTHTLHVLHAAENGGLRVSVSRKSNHL